jgi:hypothetical protein
MDGILSNERLINRWCGENGIIHSAGSGIHELRFEPCLPFVRIHYLLASGEILSNELLINRWCGENGIIHSAGSGIHELRFEPCLPFVRIHYLLASGEILSNELLINRWCGENGIRTHEPLLAITHFPGVRLRPLGHLSYFPVLSLLGAENY